MSCYTYTLWMKAYQCVVVSKNVGWWHVANVAGSLNSKIKMTRGLSDWHLVVWTTTLMFHNGTDKLSKPQNRKVPSQCLSPLFIAFTSYSTNHLFVDRTHPTKCMKKRCMSRMCKINVAFFCFYCCELESSPLSNCSKKLWTHISSIYLRNPP